MKNHDNGADYGYNNVKEDRNYDNNTASRSGYNGLLFNLIVTPRPHLGLAEGDRAPTTTALQLWRHIYVCVGLYIPYKYSINDIVNMCHKLLYTKIGV